MRKGIATVGISLFLHLFGRGEAKKSDDDIIHESKKGQLTVFSQIIGRSLLSKRLE